MYGKQKHTFYVKVIFLFFLASLIFYFDIFVNLSIDFGKFPKIKLLNSENETSQEERVKMEDTVVNMHKINCTQDKWIVLTTISLPTDDVKYIHDSSFDWCVVVVADKKTPVNWSYKNIVFLSIEVQEQMAKRFKVVILKKALNSNYNFLMLFFTFLIDR